MYIYTQYTYIHSFVDWGRERESEREGEKERERASGRLYADMIGCSTLGSRRSVCKAWGATVTTGAVSFILAISGWDALGCSRMDFRV